MRGAQYDLVRLWDSIAGTRLRTIRASLGDVTGLHWAPAATHLAVASDAGEVSVWDARGAGGASAVGASAVGAGSGSGAPAFVLRAHKKSVRALAWSASGKYVMSGGAEKVVRVWRIPAYRGTACMVVFTERVAAMVLQCAARQKLARRRCMRMRKRTAAAAAAVAAAAAGGGGGGGVGGKESEQADTEAEAYENDDCSLELGVGDAVKTDLKGQGVWVKGKVTAVQVRGFGTMLYTLLLLFHSTVARLWLV